MTYSVEQLAKQVVNNYEMITGYDLKQFWFYYNMDSDFIDETFELIQEYIQNEYGVDITDNEEFINQLDKTILKTIN